MVRVLLFLVVLALVALGLAWLVDRPGDIVLTWQGYRVETSVAFGLAVVLVAAIVLGLLWSLVRFIFRIPSLVSFAARIRRRNKGYSALSRGMIAAGAGDVRVARRAAVEAHKHLPNEPLALLLKAQAAQLAGDRDKAEAAFADMARRPDTRLVGLRGLHIEAQRRGDMDAAHHFAHEAHKVEPLAWSGKAVLDHRAAQADWPRALAALEANIAAKLVDKPTGERQRAVLETAIALDKETMEPDEALRLARAAVRRAPDLVPAVAVAARLTARKGDLRKAAKLIEAAWPASPHPELADVYLNLRPGDSTTDRLARAQTLMRLAPKAVESRLAVARTALAARDFKTARGALAPLIDGDERPSAQTCLLMADIEDSEHGAAGGVREWLARASRAPRDPVWIADGVASDHWAPASPVTGRLDAFVWQRAAERLSADIDARDGAPPPAPVSLPEPVKEPLPEAVAETLPEAAVAAAAEPVIAPAPIVPPRTTKPGVAGPVIFPLPAAPDDPGAAEEPERPKGRLGYY